MLQAKLVMPESLKNNSKIITIKKNFNDKNMSLTTTKFQQQQQNDYLTQFEGSANSRQNIIINETNLAEKQSVKEQYESPETIFIKKQKFFIAKIFGKWLLKNRNLLMKVITPIILSPLLWNSEKARFL